ncbi:hypothetical protein G6F70_004849 [Rhizopus microsporus]|uniref:Uncharacterized protein n=1 Tax=Rhizopus microsporus TaxID=58291 RepID=A0A0A1NH82_RHIZD|nr:hypothetical protein G6F71_004874 [Rhizopus microsporus]KAG1199507.1 hypothetical protein G6F70_004849 [Rhizopus microsporus]KAG1211304.1 hypothetical protein G6F69_004696 [Rhizopus microsporus]KAG1234254.1 hypothetical protein G6F67_003654 [Rhizopus microsporus]KAG1265226.1 hypothetical protein G6F68_003736 [Rhizopus microsporus]
MLLLVLFFFCFQGLLALSTFNVTLPEPNAPYVAGQMLPISYTLPDDPNLSRTLHLSILFTTNDPSLNHTELVITSNADTSQSFTFRRVYNTTVYYEHQLSYSIPNNTHPGQYSIVFVDSITGAKESVPITVRPYASPAPPARPSGKPFFVISEAPAYAVVTLSSMTTYCSLVVFIITYLAL